MNTSLLSHAPSPATRMRMFRAIEMRTIYIFMQSSQFRAHSPKAYRHYISSGTLYRVW